jgi:hypothetical protein
MCPRGTSEGVAACYPSTIHSLDRLCKRVVISLSCSVEQATSLVGIRDLVVDCLTRSQVDSKG